MQHVVDKTAVGVKEGRELCNIYHKKPGKCTWKIRSQSGKSQGKVRGNKISKSVGTLKKQFRLEKINRKICQQRKTKMQNH